MSYPSYPTTISGKIFTVPPTSADSGRYQFINLQNAEPNLGLPVLSSSGATQYALLSDPLSGIRNWSNNTIAVNGSNVGVGTDIPNQKLTVVGNLSVTGNIFGNIQALTGQQLQAAGKITQVQFNGGGVLSGDGGFTYLVAQSALVVGAGNASNSVYGSILGGSSNTISVSSPAGIVGGSSNIVNNQFGYILGGAQNKIAGDYGIVGGGLGNQVQGTYGVIGGGTYNTEQGYSNFIGAGTNNTVNGFYSLVAGGLNNQVTNDYSAIIGGQYNTSSKANTFILGSYINAISSNYTYVNNLSSQGLVTSQYVSIGTNSTANALTVVGNISASGIIYGNVNTPVSAAAGGSNTMVQYNGNGSFAGDSGFTYVASSSTVSTVNFNTNSLKFNSLSALSANNVASVTATNSFITITVGNSSLAIPLYRYF